MTNMIEKWKGRCNYKITINCHNVYLSDFFEGLYGVIQNGDFKESNKDIKVNMFGQTMIIEKLKENEFKIDLYDPLKEKGY